MAPRHRARRARTRPRMASREQPRYALPALCQQGEVPVTTGPGDRGRLRACHADREQVIGTLQAAFAQGLGTNSTRGRARRSARGPMPTWPRSPPTSRPTRPHPGCGPAAGGRQADSQVGLAGRPRVRDRHAEDRVRARRLTEDELSARAGQAFGARTYADLAALLADIPGAIRDRRHAAPARPRPGRWPGRPSWQAAAWSSRPPPSGSPPSPIRAVPAAITIIFSFSRCFSWLPSP